MMESGSAAVGLDGELEPSTPECKETDALPRTAESMGGARRVRCDLLRSRICRGSVGQRPALHVSPPLGRLPAPAHFLPALLRGRLRQHLHLRAQDQFEQAARIRSENAAKLQPALKSTLDEFGSPLAFVRDSSQRHGQGCRRLLDAGHATLRRGLAS